MVLPVGIVLGQIYTGLHEDERSTLRLVLEIHYCIFRGEIHELDGMGLKHDYGTN